MRLLILLCCIAPLAGAQHVDTILPAPAPRVIHMHGSSGTVRVLTWERPAVRVQVRGLAAPRVQIVASDDRIHIEETPAVQFPRVTIDTIHRSDSALGVRMFVMRGTTAELADSLPTKVDYIITVPRHVRVIVRASTSDIIVDGAVDSLDLSTIKGSIRATNLHGSTTLNSLDGRILAEDIRGDLRASTLGGQIVVREAEGSVNAQAVAGTIDLFNVRASKITASTYEGGISLKGRVDPRAAVALSTRSGPIALPAGSPCEDAPAGTTQVIRSGQSNNGNFMVVVTKRDSTSITSFAGPLTCTLRRD